MNQPYYFGRRSLARLYECDERIQKIMHRVMSYQLMDLTIITGSRGKREQQEKFQAGLSKVEWPNSMHNVRPRSPLTDEERDLPRLSLAIDVAPYPVDWKDNLAFARLAGIVGAAGRELGVSIRWGGDWDSDGSSRDQTFMDLGHLEIRE